MVNAHSQLPSRPMVSQYSLHLPANSYLCELTEKSLYFTHSSIYTFLQEHLLTNDLMKTVPVVGPNGSTLIISICPQTDVNCSQFVPLKTLTTYSVKTHFIVLSSHLILGLSHVCIPRQGKV